MDWYTAKRAIEVFNGKDKKAVIADFQANPRYGTILSQMHRAQLGQAIDSDDALAEGLDVAMSYRSVEDTEEEDVEPSPATIVDQPMGAFA